MQRTFVISIAIQFAIRLGQAASSCLLILHVLSECDNVSLVGGIGMKIAFNVWMSVLILPVLFKTLSSSPSSVTGSYIECIERFVVLLYNRTAEFQLVNEPRKPMFAYMVIDRLTKFHHHNVPWYSTFYELFIRGGHVWGQMVLKQLALPSSSDFWMN